jgi:trigger factor
MTVAVDADRLEKAKQKAAAQLSRRVNIPGFRKGKAPYRILLNYLGEAAILEDAIEILGNEIYKEALEESKLDPYGPGEIEGVELENGPVLKFIVPLQPEVELGGYRDVRVEYTAPTVDDDEVNRAMKSLQEQNAVVEESQQPVALANRVALDVHSHYVAEEEGEEEAEFLHEHDFSIILDQDGEPLPGFNDALVGATVGEEREFTLDVPDDEEQYGEGAGGKVHFHVTVKKIESITLPAMTDDFAARVTAEEEKPLTLLELRIRVRENLQKMGEDRYKSDYADQALEAMIDAANVHYPEAMVIEETERLLMQFDQNLRQRGLTLNDYMKIIGKTKDDLLNDYRDAAVRSLKRGLVLREIVETERITVSEQGIGEEIDRILERFEETRRDDLRTLFQQPGMRDNVRNDLMMETVLNRIVAIAKGESPEIVNEETEEKGESA